MDLFSPIPQASSTTVKGILIYILKFPLLATTIYVFHLVNYRYFYDVFLHCTDLHQRLTENKPAGSQYLLHCVSEIQYSRRWYFIIRDIYKFTVKVNWNRRIICTNFVL